MPVPPLASPVPHQADRHYEPTTGEWLAAIREDAERQLSNAAQERERKGSPTMALAMLVGSAVTAVSVSFGAFFVLRAEAQTQGAEAAKVVDLKATATASELERYKGEADGRFKRLEDQGNRNETKLDAVLNALRVPNPAPAPKDGGTP
jgi:hypothetical protein